MKGWTTAALGEVARLERDTVLPDAIEAGVHYLGLEHIESGGNIVGVGPVSNGELKSTKFAFTPHHVLYGKLRPYLAKIALPDFAGVCSTEIVPIAPGPRIDRSFLAHFLRQPGQIELATARAMEWAPGSGRGSGCGFDRVPGVLVLELHGAQVA